MKFFYVFGVYAFCIAIDRLIDDFPNRIVKAAKTVYSMRDYIERQEKALNNSSNSKMKVGCKMDRIGF